MPKNDMKSTDYYKSGKMIESARFGSEIAKQVNFEKYQKRIAEYNLNPKKCKLCLNSISYQQKYNLFCSKSCSAIYTNAPRKKDVLFLPKQTKPFDELSWDLKRKSILKEQNFKCNRCGTSNWMNLPLTLQVDHKDGINTNDVRENLEALCPNCHSQTETFCGKNKPRFNGMKKIEDDELLFCLKQTSSIRQGLLMAGLAAKGNNYDRAKKLLGV